MRTGERDAEARLREGRGEVLSASQGAPRSASNSRRHGGTDTPSPGPSVALGHLSKTQDLFSLTILGQSKFTIVRYMCSVIFLVLFSLSAILFMCVRTTHFHVVAPKKVNFM